MEQQFANAKAFASFMSQERWGRSQILYINNKMDGARRLDRVVSDIIRYASRWSIEDGGLQATYNQAAYGLGWAISSGRVNGQTVATIYAMNARQLCELIHELMLYSHNIGLYARYLMQKYPPAA